MARIAKSLATLRDQVNAAYPKRSKVSDGWIGDQAHSARKSDHNPNQYGVVQALDLTHDLDGKGDDFDAWKFAETLRRNRDRRIKYIISNGRIANSRPVTKGGKTYKAFEWSPYTGANKHAQHTHISVVDGPALYDDPSPWDLDLPAGTKIEPPPKPPADVLRRKMAKLIYDWEVRRDAKGNPQVYRPSDGSSEVAGINDRHHPAEAKRIIAMVNRGDYAGAEAAALSFIVTYTRIATGWHTDPGVEFFLRDCVFNRGPKGAARILQRALDVKDDGEVGPTTRAAMEDVSPYDLLTRLREAREGYERDVIGYRKDKWKGLTNRWNNALAAARTFKASKSAKPEDDEKEDKPPWWKRLWTWVAGAFGTFTIGGLTLDAAVIYAICALLVVGLIVFLGWVYLIPPRGKIHKRVE